MAVEAEGWGGGSRGVRAVEVEEELQEREREVAAGGVAGEDDVVGGDGRVEGAGGGG